MSLNGSVVTVGTSATVIATGKVGASWLYVHAPTGGNTIFVRPSTVTQTEPSVAPEGE